MGQKTEQMSDEELIHLFQTDENSREEVFTELYNRYSPGVYAFCRRFLGDRTEAKDVYQEAFMRFHNCLLENKKITNILGFVLTITRNLCLNEKRNSSTRVDYDEAMSFQLDSRLESDELLNLIKSSIDLLPDDYKEMFILKEYEGLKYTEIAEITNTSINTVKVKLFRAKKKLRSILEPYLADYDFGNKM